MAPLAPSDFILFEVESSPGNVKSLCAQRADVYRDDYLSLAAGGAIRTSGSWNKWYRPAGGGWAGPVTENRQNYYGSSCSASYSWCAEWGLGSLFLWIDPAATTECEVSDESGGCGSGGRLTIRVGSSRLTTCGF